MKNFSRIIFSLLTLILASCSSNSEKPAEAVVVYDCVFPNSDEAAPDWVCDAPVADIELSAVGIAEPSQAGISFMKDIAAADARGKLTAQFRVRVDRMIKSYFSATGMLNDETVDRVTQSVLKTVSSETLIGSKIYKSRTDRNGRLYVLVGLDSEATQRAAENAVNTSMNNDRALWQQFQAQKGFDELRQEIGTQALSNR